MNLINDDGTKDLTMRIRCLLPFVLLGCGSSVESGIAPDAATDAATTDSSQSGHDSGPADSGPADAGPADAAGPDAKGHDGASPEGASPDYCAQCVAMRCSSSATACYASASCKAEADCLSNCPTTACFSTCQASDPGDYQAAQGLTICTSPGGVCSAPCFWDSGGDAGQMCSQLGLTCDPLVPAFNCCAGQGTCPTPTSSHPDSYCCNAVGGTCDMGAVNPGADCCPDSNGNSGTCVGGKCAAMTCFPTAYTCNKTLPCCDSRLTCTNSGGLGGAECCGANGTTLPSSDASQCCSHAFNTNADGSVTCI